MGQDYLMDLQKALARYQVYDKSKMHPMEMAFVIHCEDLMVKALEYRNWLDTKDKNLAAGAYA